MYPSAWTAVTKDHTLGMQFIAAEEARKLRIKVLGDQFLVWSFLLCQWSSSVCVSVGERERERAR